MKPIKVITFYRFVELEDLDALRSRLLDEMSRFNILGTIIIAGEGFNSTVAGPTEQVGEFVTAIESILATRIEVKASESESNPFRRRFVKIKPEIVTLKRPVDLRLAKGTHVSASDWNDLVASDDVVILDTRNDYEVRVGTFRGAVNPKIVKFSDLPDFVDEHFNSGRDARIAMFCTGGIRCEKFAPYMKSIGFEKVYQLDGGILKYLETVAPEESLWEGECFVFDDRISVDEKLEKGKAADLSAEVKAR
jgi:UPF0176 protein